MAATSLHCYVDRTSPWLIVRVSGDLDVAGAATLRQTVLKCLADEPAAVLLDLNALTCTDDAALMSLTALARAAAAWPAIPLVAHSVTPALLGRLWALSVTRTVTVVPDAGAAAAHLAGAPAPTSARLDLVDGSDLAVIRHATREFCRRAGRPASSDTVDVVVTELATNALCHADGPRSVLITTSPHHVHIAVRDASTHPPACPGQPRAQ